jgi:RNA polymerase sigma-70 factor (ECF subfamily)
MKNDAPGLSELMARARGGDPEALGRILEMQREFLHSLAERQLLGRVAVRADASDVVQQTFLEAHRSFEQFLGRSEPELHAWLRGILDHAIAKTIRNHALLQKRDVRREQSLDDSRAGGTGLRQELNAGHSTPSQRAIRGEDEDRLTRALATLPDDQREAVRLRHLEGLPLAEIAQRLGRTRAATAGLLKRGMLALRKQLGRTE